MAGRYMLIEQVSVGAGAIVFRAADINENGRLVAVKVVGGDQGNDVLEEFFARETESLRLLRHPNVVQLLNAGTDEALGRWLVLEWLERGTLADVMWKQRYSDPIQLALLLSDLSGALAAAHRQQIVHRDIKPANILFGAEGTPKLADFNVSKLIGRSRSAKTIKHFFTPRWAAPEQLEGRPTDERSDVYALARIGAELITRYDGDDLPDLLRRLDGVKGPGALRRVLRQMLSRDVVSRPTASEAQQELEAIVRSAMPQQRVTVRLTSGVMRTVEEMQGEAVTPKDVLGLVQLDLSGALCVKFATRPSRSGGELLTILGQRYSYFAASDNAADADELTLVSAVRVAPSDRERQRAGATVLAFSADVVMPGAPPSRGRAVQSLLDELAAARSRAEAARQSAALDAARVDAWETYLELSRALKSERSRVGVVRRARERPEEGVIECEMETLLGDPEELTDAWVNSLAPGGQVTRLGLVVDTSPTRLLVRPHDDLDEAAAILPPGSVLVRDARQEEASLQRQASALSMLKQRADAEGDLLEVLARPSRIRPPSRATIVPRSRDLDEDNRAVVEQALGTDRLFLVQGPPGTGKTTVIAELIAQILVREGESRILLVSQSNIAIDNVLERLERLVPDLPAVRLGRAEKVETQARHLMLHDRLGAEAQRLQRAAGTAHECLRRLAARPVAEVSDELTYLSTVLSTDGATGDREAGLELAQDLLGIAGDSETLVKRAETMRWVLTQDPAWIGEALQVQREWIERASTSQELEELLLAGMRIVAGTCVGVVASKSIGETRFDWVIVDEAGRASPPELLVPLVRGRRLILLGDHRQLPPVLDEEVTRQVADRVGISADAIAHSLFEDLFEAVPDGVRTRLRRQYRMHPEIGSLIEHVFYPEGLEHATPADERPSGERAWGTAVRWLDTRGLKDGRESRSGSSYINQAEVRTVVGELEALARRDDLPDGMRVGVLTAYIAQRDSLADAVAPRRAGWPRLDVAILTVDAAQGKEFDLVLYSAVRSNEAGRIGFLRDERRLNVALSRARDGLTIVGDLGALVSAGARYGSNPFVGVQGWFAKEPTRRPVVRLNA